MGYIVGVVLMLLGLTLGLIGEQLQGPVMLIISGLFIAAGVTVVLLVRREDIRDVVVERRQVVGGEVTVDTAAHQFTRVTLNVPVTPALASASNA